MLTLTQQSGRALAVWRTCIASAFRTALACAIVGCTTLYGPTYVRRQVAFPAFSYVTVILIVTDATLGDTLRGCWLALYATVQGVCPAVLSLWAIGPSRLTVASTSAAVALSSFVVALPEKTHLVAKRIALGQIVIVYVIAFANGTRTEAVMHPVHVAASTAVGILASVLALLLPFPSLACYEVKQNCKLFADNASERVKLLVKAYCAENKTSALALISQSKSLALTANKVLRNIKCKQESMQWEILPIKSLKPYCMNPGEKLQDLDTQLRGMEIALSNSQSFPNKMLQPELKDGLNRLVDHIPLTLNQVKITHLPFNLPLPPTPQTQKDLPSFFFLFCFKLLHDKLMATSSTNSPPPPRASTDSRKSALYFRNLPMNMSYRRFMPALKCSISLGLAVLLGLLYSKENGFWSGLPVAISLASAREMATFKVANIKAQGTVLGTVYGVLGCFVFQKFVQIRFLSLFPWFIFSGYLRRSRMYGQAGGVSAVIGAVLILGRENFGPPSEFAIARIVETFIGLSCTVLVDLILQPNRASTLSKTQLSRCLHALHECVGLISLGSSKDKLEESQNKLKAHADELRKLAAEADVEPNFWFLPFHGACYSKLLASLSKMADLLMFGTQAIRILEQELRRMNNWKESVDKLDGELDHFKEMVGSSINCFHEVTLVKSLKKLEIQLQNNGINSDVEVGKSPIPIMLRSSGSDDEDKIEKIMSSYLGISKEVVDKIHGGGGEGEGEEDEVILGLSAIAFCMSGLVRETREVEKGIKELIQWENPSSYVNLYEITCKVHALYK